MAFQPYLFFGGNCREAFTRYQEVFGGELMVMTAADSPEGVPDGVKPETVLHAALSLPGGELLMGSDDMEGGEFGPVKGMMVSYDAKDAADAKHLLGALSEGGAVLQEVIPTFFSEGFGMCTDRFGTPWMIVAPEAAQG